MLRQLWLKNTVSSKCHLVNLCERAFGFSEVVLDPDPGSLLDVCSPVATLVDLSGWCVIVKNS